MSSFSHILQKTYSLIGAFESDFVYLYSDFRYFSQYLGELGSRDSFCRAVIQPFLDRGQTVVIASFTYTTEGCFDVLTTPTRLGALNKWILTQPEMRRSEHPLFSYTALGPKADFLHNIGKSAFGHESVFARLMGRGAVFLHVGRPVSMGNTALHHVEQYCGATYRINKAFNTRVYRGENYVGSDYTAFLRRRDGDGETFEFDFTKAAKALIDAKLIKATGEDSSFSTISCYPYDDTIVFLCDLFYRDQCIFIKSDFLQY